MKQFEEQIQNTLQTEMEIPMIVRQRADNAYAKIKQQAVNKRKMQGRVKHSLKAAAVLAAVVLATGTTAFAAAKQFGILDYFTKQNAQMSQEAAGMIVSEVVQQEKAEKTVDFKVREYLCDSNRMYLVIEAKPTDAEKYLIISEDIIGEDSVEVLNIEGVTEGTVSEYAQSQGKELMYVGVHVDTGASGYTKEYKIEEDGTALFIQSSANELEKDVNELICTTYVQPLTDQNDGEIIRDSFTFTVTDSSSEQVLPYAVVNTDGAQAAGIVLDDISITETELGIHVEFLYHKTEDLSKEQQEEIEEIGFQILGADGMELETNVDVAGWGEILEDGSYKEIRNYKKTELPDELTVLVKNLFTKEEFGTIMLVKE